MKQVEVRGPAEVRRPDVASINGDVGDFEMTKDVKHDTSSCTNFSTVMFR
jgi:hypothetical protein